ncbi:MAG: PAS domain S-box protein [Chloroflexota bacterium]|nr:PAS domain S-box protein [Chloroflexota bacterium]
MTTASLKHQVALSDESPQPADKARDSASTSAPDAIYRSIVDSQTEMICRYDADLRLLFVNKAYCTWQGLTAEALIGTSFAEKIPSEDRERAVAHVKRLNITNPVAVSVHSSILPDGTIQIIEWTDRAIFDHDGHLIEYQGVGRDVTQREQQAQQLKDYREHFDAVLNTMQDALMSVTIPDRRMIFVSRAFTDVFGYPPERFMDDGQFFQKVVHPDDLERTLRAMATCLKEGFVELEHRIVWPNGETRWIHRRAWVNFDGNGHPVRVNDSARDITDRKQAELILRSGEEQLKSLIDSQTSYLIRTDLEGRFVYWNPKFESDFGWLYEPQGMLGSLSLTSICDHHHKRTQETVEKCFAQPGAPFQVELDKPKRDGSTCTTFWEFICLTDANGVPTAFQCVGIDISAQKQAQSTAAYQAHLLQQVSDAVIATDKDLKITSWNKAAAQMYGWTEAEALGQNIDELLATEWFEESQSSAQAAISASGHWRGEVIQRDKAGEQHYIVVSVNILFDEQNLPIGGVTVNRDITIEKRQDILQKQVSQVLEATAQGQTLPTILNALVHAIETFEPDIKASVLLLDPHTNQLREGAAPSLPASYNLAVDGVTIGSGVGSCGTAAYEKRLVIVNDIATDPLWANYRELAAAHGLKACWSQPIIGRGGQVLGTFALYYETIRHPSEAELSLIRMAAHIAGLVIEHAHAQTALKQSEEQYRSLVESSDAVIAVFDEAGTLQFANVIAAAQLGKQASELIGKRMDELFPTGAALSQLTTVREVIRTGQGIVHEDTTQLPGGTRWFRISIQPIRTVNGTVSAALVHASDITQSKAAEALVQRSEKRYRQMFERVNLPKLIIDPQTLQILDANPAAVSFYGYSLNSLTSMNMAQINVAEPEAIFEKMSQVIKGEITSCLFEQRLASGVTRDVEGFATEIEHNGKQVLYCTYIDVTERNHAVAALEQSNQELEQRVMERTRTVEQTRDRIEAIFNHSGDGILLLDSEFRIVQSNYAFDAMFAAPHDLYFDKSVLELMREEDRTAFEAHRSDVIAQRQTRRMEIQGKRIDGSVFDAEISIAPVNRSRQAVENIVCIIRDISERKQAEEALRIANERLQLATSAGEIGIWDYDAVNNKMIWDKQMFRFYGLDEQSQEPSAELWESLLHPDDIEQARADVGAALAGERAYNTEFRIVWPNGETRYLRSKANFYRDNHGRPLRMVGMNMDITEQENAERAIRASEEKFRMFIESAPIAVIITNMHGEITLANAAAAQLFDYPCDELIGQSVQVLVPESLREKHHLLITDYSLSQHRHRSDAMELTACRRNGEIFSADIQLSHVQVEREPVIMAFVIDITHRKQAEVALRNALDKERELNELKSRFVSMASHQFRTPLSAILANTESLTIYRNRMTSDDIDLRLNRIRNQVSHMKSIMEDILELARIQANQVQYQPRKEDLGALCIEIIEGFDHLEAYAGRILYQGPERSLMAEFDPHWMHHLISNIVHNALKYSPDKQAVYVTLSQQDHQILLHVKDQGIGIPSEDLQHIFEPFYRAGNTGAVSGTGLGLSIAKQAVDAHGGTIHIESTPGAGTSVTVTLPYRE